MLKISNIIHAVSHNSCRLIQTHRSIPKEMLAVMQPILKAGTTVESAHLVSAITQSVTLIKGRYDVALSKKDVTELSNSLNLVIIPLPNTLSDTISKSPDIQVDTLRDTAKTKISVDRYFQMWQQANHALNCKSNRKFTHSIFLIPMDTSYSGTISSSNPTSQRD